LSKREPGAFGLVDWQKNRSIWDADSSPYAFTLREKNKPHCLTRSSGMAAFSFRASGAGRWKQRAYDDTPPGIGGVAAVLQS